MSYLTMFLGVLFISLNLNAELLPEGLSTSTTTATNTESVIYTDDAQLDSQKDTITTLTTTILRQQIDLNSKIILVKPEMHVVTTEDIHQLIDSLKSSVGLSYDNIYNIIENDVDRMKVEMKIKHKSNLWFPILSCLSLIMVIICDNKNKTIWKSVFGIFLFIFLVFTCYHLPDILISIKGIDRSIIYSLLE